MVSLKKSDELATKLHDKLERIGINYLARYSGFVRRKPKKRSPLHFLIGYFITVLCHAFSYESHAKNVGLLSSEKVSKQAFLNVSIPGHHVLRFFFCAMHFIPI